MHSTCNFIFSAAHKFIPHVFYMPLQTLYCTEIHFCCIQHATVYSLLHINSFLRHSTCNFMLSTAHKCILYAFYAPLHTLYCTEIHFSCIQHEIFYPQLHTNSFFRHSTCNFIHSLHINSFLMHSTCNSMHEVAYRMLEESISFCMYKVYMK